ncbi:MAG TPA: rhodanese-like domain-containing protein [Gemmatimonadaceae bacterium]|jgi:thiosulfate/3-mercaptopyruvate sulfurtransferase|nr:rhodanese-like domain-containing protein [Gemmatimonadaceae bacterium]
MIRLRMMLIGAAVVFATSPCQVAAQKADDDSVLVSTAWLAKHLSDPKLVVLYVGHDTADAKGDHIPGSRFVSYMDITAQRDGLGTELPPVDKLKELFENAGVSSGSRVVIYGHMAPMASRAFFTLDYLGNVHASVLDGGLAKWKREGRPVAAVVAKVAKGAYTPKPRSELVVDAAWIQPRLGKPGTALIDTRTDGEYIGDGERHGMPSAGHLLGGRQLEWEQLFKNPDEGEFLDRAALAKLYAARVQPGDTVVTYCWVGYRASMTYLAARALGYPTRLYDGSYQDWSRRNLPVVKGTSPKG